MDSINYCIRYLLTLYLQLYNIKEGKYYVTDYSRRNLPAI